MTAKPTHAQLAKQYDAFADSFSELSSGRNLVNRSAFYAQIDLPLVGKIVLDLACGDGTDMLHYQSEGAVVYGIDASEEMVRIAKARMPEADIRLGHMEELPYPDNFFDVVLSKYAIQTSWDIAPIFAEVARVLKPSGMFVYLVTHPLRQFMERRRGSGKDYFEQEVIDMPLFNGQIIVREPTHTMNEYFSANFFKNFDIVGFEETCDLFSAELVEGNFYPGFFIAKAKKREK